VYIPEIGELTLR